MLRFLGFLAIILLWTISPAAGQTPRRDSIPTYLPVWQRTEDLNDYVSPKHTTHSSTPDVLNDLSLTRKPTMLNLFRFPADSVTYLLNGHVYTDPSRVREVLADPKKQIREVSVDKLDRAGKRVIRIRHD